MYEILSLYNIINTIHIPADIVFLHLEKIFPLKYVELRIYYKNFFLNDRIYFCLILFSTAILFKICIRIVLHKTRYQHTLIKLCKSLLHIASTVQKEKKKNRKKNLSHRKLYKDVTNPTNADPFVFYQYENIDAINSNK